MKAEFLFLSDVLADIGDSQSIEQNLSTFSSHTNKVIEILDTADEHSLVLLDELGSGTDPVEGAALAVSIIRRLMANGAKIMVTTHYQELKVFAIDSENVENASCEFDIETLRPTYRLIVGSPGKSNAFAISESLGMPKADIIEDAKTRVSEANTRLEEVIGKLEAARLELERQKEEISVCGVKLLSMRKLSERKKKPSKRQRLMNWKRRDYVQ